MRYPPANPEANPRSRVRIAAAVLLPAFLIAPQIFGASLNVTVKDPSGGLVAAATVALSGPSGAPRQKVTNIQGRAEFDQLAAGSWSVTVSKTGFDAWQRNVTIAGKPVDLAVSLKLSSLSTSMKVSGSRSPLANSDPNYIALRDGRLTRVYRVNNYSLTRDAGAFTFRSGSFSFLPPVLGHVTVGVFVGDGNFRMTPAFDLAAKHLARVSGADSVNEDFTSIVLYFSDSTFDEIKQHSELADELPDKHEAALKRVDEILRTRRDPPRMRPMTLLERLLNFEDIPNYDAEILEELYNSEPTGSFRAFIHGAKHPDLRFLVNPHGAIPTLPAPEEVALLNYEPTSNSDGIWYLSHLASELQAGRASSNEEKRLIEPEHYKIDSLIRSDNALGNHPDLAVVCDLRFRALADGVRMVKFDLVPDLQVTRVSWNGSDIPFVQESHGHDGSFYLQAPEAMKKDRTYNVTFEYTAAEILQGTKLGALTVPTRRIWYPTPSGAASRATYDLIFRIPRKSRIVTVGNEVNESQEAGFDVSEWVTNAPITQAVFQWRDATAYKTAVDETTGTKTSVYMSTHFNGILPPTQGAVLTMIGNALRLFDTWFGKLPYENLSALVETGGPVDSLPGLVYVRPVMLAGYASTYTQSVTFNAWRPHVLMPPTGLYLPDPPLQPTATTALDEAFPTVLAREWWGNAINPISFHDAWLSAGLANFSASLYDTAAENGEFIDHWDKAREALLVSARWGVINNAGPVWMGALNDVNETPAASGTLNFFKGAFVVQMLRGMLWSPQTGDSDFRSMMQDFFRTYANRAVSTEDFKATVEQHMNSAMDLEGNHRMSWFFNEWLYGSDIPSYRLEYSLKPGDGGATQFSAKLTQSGVSPEFRMPVPIFAEVGGTKQRIAVAAMHGDETRDFTLSLRSRPKQILLNINHDILTQKDETVLVR